MSTGGRVLGGAATGAAAGSMFGPWGTAIGGIGGGLMGLFGGGGEDDAKAAEDQAAQQKLDAMRKASAQLAAYRPQAQNAAMQGIANRSEAYQGANDVLASMYGSRGAQVPPDMLRNPMTGQMSGVGGLQPGQGGQVGMGAPTGMNGPPGMGGAPQGPTRHFQGGTPPMALDQMVQLLNQQKQGGAPPMGGPGVSGPRQMPPPGGPPMQGQGSGMLAGKTLEDLLRGR